MELSEAIVVSPIPQIDDEHHRGGGELGFLESSSSADLDRAPSDPDQAVMVEAVEEEVKELYLKVAMEEVGDEFQKLDLQAEEVGVEVRKLELKPEDDGGGELEAEGGEVVAAEVAEGGEVVAVEVGDEVRKLEMKAEVDGGGELGEVGDEVRKVEVTAADGCGTEWEVEVEVEERADDWGEGWKGYENGSDIWGKYEQSGGGDGGGGQNESDDGGGGGDVEKAAESWRMTYQYYPVRPEAEDCSFYLKTGTCKFGSNCKFNHPVKRKTNQVPKERAKEREESAESPGQTECKYYSRPGGCKYGKSCRYIHSKEKPTVAPVMDTNFAGLPIRPGEKECAYYMRHGECKYASNCRFSHPDPVAEGGSDPSSGYDKGGPALQGASEATWSVQRSLNETPAYVPMMIPLSPGVPSQTTEWNGYQSPARSMPARPPYVMNNSMTESNIYKQYPYLNQVEEFPERPGQPVCSYFLRTGDCKFKSSCKYHHPKIRTAVFPSYTLNDNGLPLRPDQNICTHYSRYGICKFGPACKFDHPLHITSSTTSGPDQQLPFSDSAANWGVPAGADATPVMPQSA